MAASTDDRFMFTWDAIDICAALNTAVVTVCTADPDDVEALAAADLAMWQQGIDLARLVRLAERIRPHLEHTPQMAPMDPDSLVAIGAAWAAACRMRRWDMEVDDLGQAAIDQWTAAAAALVEAADAAARSGLVDPAA